MSDNPTQYYIDTETATWGVTEDLVFVDSLPEDIAEGSDSEIKSYGVRHGDSLETVLFAEAEGTLLNHVCEDPEDYLGFKDLRDAVADLIDEMPDGNCPFCGSEFRNIHSSNCALGRVNKCLDYVGVA